jgi:pyruvyltransferase
MYLHYFRGCPNFGDELSPVIVDWMLETSALRSEVRKETFVSGEPKLAALGSLMHHLDSDYEVWGTGVMNPTEKPNPNLRFSAVRGPMTRKYLLDNGYTEEQVPEVYGDPALLLPEIYTPKVLPWMSDLWVVIPHHLSVREMRHNMNQEDLDDLTMFGFHVVYPDEGWEKVVDAIANAKGVISQSLHGLIVADAYGVPNVWWNTGVLNGHDSHFKFLDYFQSQGQVGRGSILHIGEINEMNWRYLMGADKNPRNKVDLEALKAAFPTESLSR